MLLCLAKTDDVRLIASLRVGHVHDDAVEPAEQIDPLLTIGVIVATAKVYYFVATSWWQMRWR